LEQAVIEAPSRVDQCPTRVRGPASLFRTTHPEHSGVKLVMEQRDVNLAGPVNVLSDGGFKTKYGALFSGPEFLRILREYYAGIT
jgi:ATP sulfurylase